VGAKRGSDPLLLILVSLAGSPKHGHAMLLDIQAFAGLRLGPGTLYGAIGRLEEHGLIEAMPAHGRRRPYRLTPDGNHVLRSRLSSLGGTVRAGLERVAG